jgi:hypothetical protein
LAEPLRVEVPTDDLARALMDRLRGFPVELADHEVRVTLVGNPDRAVTDVLHSLDTWLLESDVPSVQVHLDDRTYTLNQPRP